MKIILKLTILFSIGICLLACKKDSNYQIPSASLMVTNVVVGGATLTLNTTAQTVNNNNYIWFPILVGSPVILANTATTPATPYYNQSISLNNMDSYSLFLSGTSPSQVDAVLVKENYLNYTDSLCGVRFINLAPGSNPISVNIKGNANGSEISSLSYKAYSSFKQYAAKAINTSYSFEIRDVGTGNLITSYTMATPYFHNVTIALRGVVGGAPAPGITLIKYY